MPRIRHTVRFPSYRNLDVYHRLVCDGLSQTALAKQLGISQRRVSQIAQQVRQWVDDTLLPRYFRGRLDRRFHLAVANERVRLHDAYEPLLAQFTGADGFPGCVRRYIAVVNGQALNTLEVSDKPDFRTLNKVMDILSRQSELVAIAVRGPFAELPRDVCQTIVHTSGQAPPEVNHEMTSSLGFSPSSINPLTKPSTSQPQNF